MFNPNDTPMKPDDYLGVAPSGETPVMLAQRMVREILVNRGPDNGSDGGNVNHLPEELTAALFNAVIATLPPAKLPMTGERVCLFHLCHGFSRVIVSALEGKVLWDKIVDHGGWTTVLADRQPTKEQTHETTPTDRPVIYGGS